MLKGGNIIAFEVIGGLKQDRILSMQLSYVRYHQT